MNLTDDGGVIKKIMINGRNDDIYPSLGYTIKVHCVGSLLDGNEFQNTRLYNKPFEFVLRQGNVIDGFLMTVQSMSLGEVCKVTINSKYAYGDKHFPPHIPAKATLVYEIELLEFGKKIDIAEGMITKWEEGPGNEEIDRPSYESKCTIEIIGTVENNDNKAFYKCKSLEFIIGNCHVPRSLERIVETMNVGEICTAYVDNEYRDSHKNEELRNSLIEVPQESNRLVYKIKLIDCKSLEFDQTNIQEVLKVFTSRKDDGGNFFKDGLVSVAIRKYKHAIQVVDKFYNDLKYDILLCNLNLCACYLNVKKYKKVLTFSDKVLDIEEDNIKALYRRARALEGLYKWEDAMKVYNKCLSIDSDNNQLTKSKQLLRNKMKKQKDKDRKAYGNIFN